MLKISGKQWFYIYKIRFYRKIRNFWHTNCHNHYSGLISPALESPLGKAGNVLLMDAGVKPLKTIRMAYTLLDVWKKATVVPNVDSTKWRKDQCGAWIGWEYYGNRSSDYGWEIDHITPVSKGGLDILSNVRPLQWENNASRQDDRLCCKITSSGNKNVEK